MVTDDKGEEEERHRVRRALVSKHFTRVQPVFCLILRVRKSPRIDRSTYRKTKNDGYHIEIVRHRNERWV